MSYAGKWVTVVGLGREGQAVTRVLAREGARVTVSDTRDERALAESIAALDGLPVPVRYALGAHSPDRALDCDLLVLSPGVDKRAPLVREALRRGIPITSETELFFARCPAPIIGVTGTSGKTTTTTLIGQMLRRDGARPVYVGGNIGLPLLEHVDEITSDARVVLELSSFQLEWLKVSPAIAVVTNVTPNHLDRHETMEAYAAAKSNIVAHQRPGDMVVLNADDPLASSFARLTPGRVLYFSLVSPVPPVASGVVVAYLDGDGETLMLARDGRRETLCHTSDIQALGRHTVANVLAAATVAAACGVATDIIAATARAFAGVTHRLQRVGVVDGVTFYDDSIATSPERTRAALAAIPGPGAIVLILGGRDKRLPWAELARAAARRCRGVVLIGEAAGLIRGHLEAELVAVTSAPGRGETPALPGAIEEPLLQVGAVVDATSMEEAVERALALAWPGDAVVLAPACASYDMFRDFEERGDLFARAVRRLGGLESSGKAGR